MSENANPLSFIPESCLLDRTLIIQLVRSYAGPTTDAILDPLMEIFSTPDVNGFIAYRRMTKVMVVIGDPTCLEEDKPALAMAFHRFVTELGATVVYVTVSKKFALWANAHLCRTMIEYGEELTLDPFRDPLKESGDNGSLVRRKTKQATREGVTIHEYLGESDPALERAIETVGELWLQARRGPQFHISNIHLFENRLGKRWFYAKIGDEVVGVVILNQLHAHQGWHLNHLMSIPDGPNGTTELLVTSVLDALRKEDCHFVSVGIATTKDLGQIVGLGKISSWIARFGFKIARKIAYLDGLNMFWKKFHPKREPSYLLFCKNGISIHELIGLRSALNGSSGEGK